MLVADAVLAAGLAQIAIMKTLADVSAPIVGLCGKYVRERLDTA